MSKMPAIKVGNVFRYRQRYGIHGLFKVAELVRKRNGWWVIGHDRKRNRTVEVQPGGVFTMGTSMSDVMYGPANKWRNTAA